MLKLTSSKKSMFVHDIASIYRDKFVNLDFEDQGLDKKYSDYGMFMSWTRPENAEEESTRLASEKIAREYCENRDRAEFERLQAKYGK